MQRTKRFSIERLEERIAPSNGNGSGDDGSHPNNGNHYAYGHQDDTSTTPSTTPTTDPVWTGPVGVG